MNDIIIITGGASGLGKELIKESLNMGLSVRNIDRNRENMNKMSQQYSENYNHRKKFLSGLI